MTIPTDEELKIALKEAGLMRERGEDPKFIAKALLSLNYRMKFYDDVFQAANHFLYFGMEESDHQLLIKAIEDLKSEELRSAKLEPPELGL